MTRDGSLWGPSSTAQGAQPCPRPCRLLPTTQEGRSCPRFEPPPTSVLRRRAGGPRNRPSPFSGLLLLVSGTLTLRVTPEPLAGEATGQEASADLGRPSIALTVGRFGVRWLVAMRRCVGGLTRTPPGPPQPPSSPRLSPGAQGGPGSPRLAPRPPTPAPWRARSGPRWEVEPPGTRTPPRALSAELSLKVLSVVAICYCRGHRMLGLSASKTIKEVHLLLTYDGCEADSSPGCGLREGCFKELPPFKATRPPRRLQAPCRRGGWKVHSPAPSGQPSARARGPSAHDGGEAAR